MTIERVNLHRFLEGYGIKVRPYRESRTPRPANVVYGGRTVRRLMKKDEARCGLVIRCIQASDPRCLDDMTIWAVWSFIDKHSRPGEASALVPAFRRISLAEIKNDALRLSVGQSGRMAKTSVTTSILIARAILEADRSDD